MEVEVTFPLVVAAVLTLLTLVPALLVGLLRLLRRRPQRRFWRVVVTSHLALFPLHLFVTFPLLLGWFGSRWLGTRGDEQLYAGPRIAADGEWLLQDRRSLAAEARGDRSPNTAVARAAMERAVSVPGAGVSLRAFRVAAPESPPRAVVLLVHGLFRCAVEVEQPAAMFRRMGCEVWLLEQRNHGGSGRHPATFGLRESEDLVVAAEFIRQRPELADVPLFLFGVSLGSVSVMLALPDLPSVQGVVLDAPVHDLLSTAQRMLGLRRPGDDRGRFTLVEPWRSLVLTSLQLWSGFELQDVRPDLALQGMPADFPVLLVAGADDDKVPVDHVRQFYDSLPMLPGVKQLWAAEDCGHGDAWQRQSTVYEQRLRDFLQQALATQ